MSSPNCEERLLQIARDLLAQSTQAIDNDGQVRSEDERCRAIFADFSLRVAEHNELQDALNATLEFLKSNFPGKLHQ